jgi:siroheme decarboxylase
LSKPDQLENQILDAIQSGFPACRYPFRELARKLGIEESVLIEKIRLLKEQGVIRRFGAVFDSRKLGYLSTLVAVRIPEPDHLPAVAEAVNRYSEVTHNYQRDDSFNLWFTLIAPSAARIEEIIRQVEVLDGVAQVQNLPAQELYKISASFKSLGGQSGEN